MPLSNLFWGYSSMRTQLIVMINLHTKFELSSFICSRYMIGASKFKSGLCDPDHTNLEIVCQQYTQINMHMLAHRVAIAMSYVCHFIRLALVV